MSAVRTTPPFRADHVGSLLRPAELLDARADFDAGRIGTDDLRAVEDEAIRDAVQLQKDAGLLSATDGEFRRATWHMDFIYQIGGISQAPGDIKVQFQNEHGTVEWTPAALHVTEKIHLDHTIFADAFEFLKSNVNGATPKLTIPSPNMVHYRGGRAAVDERIYPDMDEFWSDLCAAYADELRALGELGCTYLQFDDTSLAYLNDPRQREQIKQRGASDVEHLHEQYVRNINRALEGKPDGMVVTTHLCRGNFRSSWAAEGGYDYVAEALFGGLGSCPRASSSCSGWSRPSTASSSRRMCSSGGSKRPRATYRSISCACRRSAASPRPSRATPSPATRRSPSSS
jgi:5-methyltetrahydropteroyltriglutamate--homocysteine methyltransferase